MSSTMKVTKTIFAELEKTNNELKEKNEELKKENEALQKEDDKRFLNKYLVPNFFLKEHFEWADEWSDLKWYDFKRYVSKWACAGELNDIMKEIMDNWEYDDDEEEDESEDEEVCKNCDETYMGRKEPYCIMGDGNCGKGLRHISVLYE